MDPDMLISVATYLALALVSGEGKNPVTRTGQATYYAETDGSGNCMFDATPTDLMVAAMNRVAYNRAAMCGAYVEVTGPQGTVTVRVVD